jgi:hypothetical protein
MKLNPVHILRGLAVALRISAAEICPHRALCRRLNSAGLNRFTTKGYGFSFMAMTSGGG